jgi:hypothetical protein
MDNGYIQMMEIVIMINESGITPDRGALANKILEMDEIWTLFIITASSLMTMRLSYILLPTIHCVDPDR